MVPIIALVGRSNVGKSTLFNRLTQRRDALVGDFPGLTRDRQYGRMVVQGKKFIIIDTGGLNGYQSGIDARINYQSILAIEEADIILFMVDAHTGLMPADKSIAQHLRNKGKNAFLVVNKTDGLDPFLVTADFYSLGLRKVYAIMASHGRGVKKLIQNVLIPYFSNQYETLKQANDGNSTVCWHQCNPENLELNKDKLKDNFCSASLPIKLAIVGKPNVGKSTLTNYILGEERVVVHDTPGTTRDSIYIPMTRDRRSYILIDTAGVRKRRKVTDTIEKYSIIQTLQSIEDAHVVILVINAQEDITDQDLSLLRFILNAGRSLVLVLNKWDKISKPDQVETKEKFYRRFCFIDFARLHFTSALQGIGISNLFHSILEAYTCATKRVSTSVLTKIMQSAINNHPPPIFRGHRIKMKYAHSGGYNPPIVVIHGNRVHGLSDSYKRYLMNHFRNALKLIGTPICIQVKEGENPFISKHPLFKKNHLRKKK